MVNSSGNAIIHDPNFDWTGDNFVMPPWNELVIYEMHVGTFNDAPGTGPGTFDEIIPKLPTSRDLGINAIEIMPVVEFPMDFSWGYNPAQPFAVETALGGPQGLYRFVKAAHAHGIAVILDVVYNHFGPGDLDLWRFDGWTDGDHNGGIYFYDNARAHTVGRHPPRLRPPRSAPVHPRQRAVLAEQIPAGRLALRFGEQHPQSHGTTTTRPTICRTAGACCSGSTTRSARRSRGKSPSPRICRTTNGSPKTPEPAARASARSGTRALSIRSATPIIAANDAARECGP